MSKCSSNINVENIIIFGYAAVGKRLYERVRQEKTEANIVFCDNSSTKQGMHDDIQVLSLQEVIEKYGTSKFIVASLRHAKQMEQQLLEAGIPQGQIITELPGDIVGEELAKEQKQRLVPLDSIHVEVNINKDCNLNCKGCDHFAPVAEADTLELDVFERDMKRLSEIMTEHIHRIILLGGEPLLNEQLLDYVRIARRCMPETEVFIATNGTLLGRMKDEFWTVLKENRTGLMVTKYPVSLDYEELRKKAVEKGVVWEYLGSSESGRTLWHFPLDLSGNQDAMESFLHCANANSCHTLERGRLYTCSIAPNVKVFNKYFNQHIPLKEEDGIDIYKAKSAEEILTALAKPMPFCSYCDVKHRTYDHGWETSRKDLKEWIL
ncbi:radical SAM protein [Selenomonas caprae]|uniref:Radical SAM protein n=1 Tax=Selenomonas caprae TaxID=2606905 RepID=A0A5D6WNI7_9FIRM|nr:radical SAM protein [Selenomonas caprae]TYZ28962.1 radical SAM protein [Selenomonas caprae]